MRFFFISIALVLSHLARCEQEVVIDLNSKDEITLVRSLWQLSKQNELSKDTQKTIAALMTVDWKGKRLSKWCYYALCKTGAGTDDFYKPFLQSVVYLHFNVVPVGEVGAIGGDDPGEKDGPRLPEDLKQPNEMVWRFAVETVWPRFVQDKKAIVQWAGEEEVTPPEAIRGLGIPASIGVPFLASRMQDSKASEEEREYAAESIGNLRRFAGSVEPLLSGLKDPSPKVRAAAARSLGELSYPFDYYGGWIDEPTHPDGIKTSTALVEVLRNDTIAEVRSAALSGLSGMKDEARSVAPQIAAVFPEEKDKDVRVSIVRALGEIHDPAFADVLISALKDTNENTRSQAAGALGQLAYGLTFSKKASALGKLNALSLTAIPALVDSLKDTKSVREMVQQALFYFGPNSEPAVPELIRVLKTANADEASTIIQALGAIGRPAREALPFTLKWASNERVEYTLSMTLGKIGIGGDEVETALLLLSKSKNYWVRREAAKSIGLLGMNSPAVLERLEEMVKTDPEIDTKNVAREALQLVRTKEQPEKF